MKNTLNYFRLIKVIFVNMNILKIVIIIIIIIL